MKFALFCLPTIPATLEEREQLRPIGRNPERYQQMIEELRTLVGMADDAGFDVFSTTEHHFHSEGYEVSVNPLLLYTDLAARTKNIKFGPLGMVLPTHDPIRLAEDIAIVDHLTKGRLYGGFARGYQDRWVNVLGQHYHVKGTPMDGGEADAHNRAVYEEFMDLMKRAWTEESLEFKGNYYQIPNPYDEGIQRWPAQEWTRRFGAPGEIDDAGVIRKICVVPAPYQQPYPPLFQPFSVSERTIRYTAEESIVPWVLISHPEEFRRLCEVYQQVANQNGRDLQTLGQSVGAFRSVHFGNTEQEAVELLSGAHYEGWNCYLGEFGFWEALRAPGDAEQYPLDPYTPLPKHEWTPQRMRDVKYALAGTPDQVKREIEELHKIHGAGGELEWFGWFFDQGFMSHDEEKRQIELFAEHIIPEFK